MKRRKKKSSRLWEFLRKNKIYIYIYILNYLWNW